MTDLRPCPFCGKEPRLMKGLDDGEVYYFVMCRNNDCHINVTTHIRDTEAKAISAWNTRYTDDNGK